MLSIRAEQMGVFEAVELAAFEDRMVQAVLEDRRDLHESAIRELVRYAVSTGRRNGIVTEGPVAVLIELMVAFGRDFELTPHGAWARNTLADTRLPGKVRAIMMRERLAEAVGGRRIVRQDG